MGLVYRAYHEHLERSAAVKVLQGIAAGPDAAARFRHEAQAIAQMRHPNIVNVYDFGEYEGTPYMIVEYVPGGNLAARMQQTPMDHENALKCLRGMAAGLDYAHSMGIVHRDVKPGNVLLEKDGSPVLADFGLVKLLQGSSVQSLTGVTTGTPAYMSPEQVTGSQVGPAADRYSLATMAYEMLTGVIPFDGEGVLELLYAHVHRDPPPPSSRNAALGGSVDAVIMRGLAKDPEARWESCAAFVEALTAALAGAPAAMAATMPVVYEKPAAMAMPSSPPSNASKPGRRIIEIIASAVILLLLLVAGGICAAANQKPTMALDPPIVVPGDQLTVTANHLPASQFGQIQLSSDEIYLFAFQADGRGNVRQSITIPGSITNGNHHVSLCWSGSCQLQKPLRVVAPGSLPTPTPSANPSPTSSGSPTTSPTPTTRRSPTPVTSPKSSPTATPSATSQPSITLVSVSTLLPRSTKVVFHNFHGGSATVYVWQSGSAHPAAGIVVQVAAGSNITVTFPTPKGISPLLGTAFVRACGSPCFDSNRVTPF